MRIRTLNRMASPSGKLCNARPIPTAMPVFNKLFPFLLSLFCTIISHIIIVTIPKIMPVITVSNSAICSASGIKSKHTIPIINPEAREIIKLNTFFDTDLNFSPISPPYCSSKCPKE